VTFFYSDIFFSKSLESDEIGIKSGLVQRDVISVLDEETDSDRMSTSEKS
jgi:hypothetical protein